MKEYKIAVFTDEYFIDVVIGSKKELEKVAKKFSKGKEGFNNCRGKAYDFYPDFNPSILVDGDLPWPVAVGTLAHETSHAMTMIEEYLGIDDGEFHAHGIGAVVRKVAKDMYKKKAPKR